MNLTDDQKAALDQLFDEVWGNGFHYSNEGHLRPGSMTFYEEDRKRLELETTFADRVAEILKPKEGEG